MIKNYFKTKHYKLTSQIKKFPFLPVLLFVWLCVIWGHSMQPAYVSSNESGTALVYINNVLHIFGIEVSEFVIRKMAHFSEFMILGILLNANMQKLTKSAMQKLCIICTPISRRLTHMTSLLLGVICAMIDETIQLFTYGRSCEVRDVWIDFSGVILGTIIFMLINHALDTRFRNRN